MQFLYNSGYGWYSKAFMIILGLTLIFLHRKPREYGLFPRNMRSTFKWSMYTPALFALVVLVATAIAELTGSLKPLSLETIVVDVVWFFIFASFAEEIFFRGYIQSRLNEAFIKEYKSMLGVKFSWKQGTLITGVVFFGIAHIFVGINPFKGVISTTPSLIIVSALASFLGIIFGVIREKTGDIILPTILHGLVDSTVYILGKASGIMISNIAAAIALFL